MKKSLLIFAVTCAAFFPFNSQAQEFRLVALGGYTFQDRIPTYEGDGYLRDAGNFGGMAQYLPSEDFAISFLYKYSKQEFDFSSYSYYYNSINDLPVAVSYYMFGGSRFFNGNDEQVAPFGSFYLGWSTFSPDDDYSSFSRFSLGFDLGVSVKLNDFLGLNLRSELMMPVSGFGTSIYCGTGSGCGGGAYSYTPLTQFSFTGGVEIRIAPKAKSADYYSY